MESLMERFTEEAEAAGLTAQNTNRWATPLPVAMRGATSAHPPPPGVTHLGRDRQARVRWRAWSGRGSAPMRSKTAAPDMWCTGQDEDRDRASVILFDSDGGCGRGSGAPASVPARTIGGVANSARVT